MKGVYLLLACASILLTLSIHPSDAIYDVTRYCHLVPIGSKLPSFESCKTYYTCQANGYTKHACNTNESFDKDSQACMPSSAVKCYYGQHNPCSRSDNTFLPNPENCKGYISCSNRVELGRGNCPDGQIFDSINQECKYGTCRNEIGSNANGDLEDVCKIMQVKQYFGDFKRCGTWKFCTTSGRLVQGSCGNGLVYDAPTRMCLKDDGQMCARLQVPAYACDAFDKDTFKSDSYICSNYYVCDGKSWHKHTCPLGDYFDVLRNTCVQRQLATPIASCNRCQYATVKWANSVDAQCRHYLECNLEGRKITEGACDAGAYFHEAMQSCIMGGTDLNEYRKHNGACNAANNAPENPSNSQDTTKPSTASSLTCSSESQGTTKAYTASPMTSTTVYKPTTSYTSFSTAEATTSTSTYISTKSTDQSTLSTNPTSSTTTTTTPTPTSSIIVSTTSTVSPQEKCAPRDKGISKGDPNICSVYFMCNGDTWLRRECPNQQYFDRFSNRCTDRQLATPIVSCDRCQHATAQWVNAVDPQCSKYVICSDGRKAAQNTCGTKSYFDEKRQACIKGVSKFEAYQQQNGACKKAV